MKGKIIVSVSVLIAISGIFVSTASATAYSDQFNGPSVDPGWGVDRYLPQVVDIQTASGQSALHLGVTIDGGAANRPPAYSSTFYNYQGIQHSVSVSGLWTASEQILVTPDMLSGMASVGFWIRTGLPGDENTADYNILSFRNPTGSNPGFFSFDDVNGLWLSTPASVGLGWHGLQMEYTGGSVIYSIDGSVVRTDTAIGNPLYANNVTTVFNQIYNFGDRSYDGYFDNLNVKTPDVGASAGLLLCGCSILGLLKRRSA